MTFNGAMSQTIIWPYCKLVCFKFKHISLILRIFFFCNTLILACSNTAMARDLGTHGVIAPIEEADPIALIQQKLKILQDSGELERRNLELQKKARASVERPKPVEGITKATKGRVFTYDPTYEVKVDLKDHLGRIFAKKGTKINPLETVSLSQNLLFFDGDDEEQVAFASEKLKEGSVKLILTKGAPLALSDKLKVPVYFDQNGVLIQKFSIGHVPAFITQEGDQLRIEEIDLRQVFPSTQNKDL